MKKILVLFVLAFGLMSFSSSKELNPIEDENQFVTCCTATVTYNGEYHSSYTACVEGIGPETTALACAIAGGKAKAFIAKQ